MQVLSIDLILANWWQKTPNFCHVTHPDEEKLTLQINLSAFWQTLAAAQAQEKSYLMSSHGRPVALQSG